MRGGWLAAMVMAGLVGCAARPPADEPEAGRAYEEARDPWEPFNRLLYRVNDAADRVAVVPLARGYNWLVPSPVRGGLHNFLRNLETPALLMNDVAQGKPRRAGDTFMRFLINSSLGLFGLFDVAARLGYRRHETGFGVTLALWGVPEGPYYFSPIVGPSSYRAIGGFVIDTASDPLIFVPGGLGLRTFEQARFGTGLLDGRARHLQDIERVRNDALDPYATLRSFYRQSVAALIAQTREDRRATVPDWYSAARP